MRRRATVLLVLAACVSDTVYPPAPDAWVRPASPVKPFEIFVRFRGGEPARPGPIGFPGAPVVEAFWTPTSEHTRRIDLYGRNRLLLRSIDLSDADGLCADRHELGAPPQRFFQTVCVLWSGDVRVAKPRDDDGGWSCDEPTVCPATCGAHAPCGPGERCTSRRTTPISTHMACAPIGPRRDGEACSLVDDAAGAYDDCGENSICENGTCRRLCSPAQCLVAGPDCQFIHGQPPELRFCF